MFTKICMILIGLLLALPAGALQFNTPDGVVVDYWVHKDTDHGVYGTGWGGFSLEFALGSMTDELEVYDADITFSAGASAREVRQLGDSFVVLEEGSMIRERIYLNWNGGLGVADTLLINGGKHGIVETDFYNSPMIVAMRGGTIDTLIQRAGLGLVDAGVINTSLIQEFAGTIQVRGLEPGGVVFLSAVEAGAIELYGNAFEFNGSPVDPGTTVGAGALTVRFPGFAEAERVTFNVATGSAAPLLVPEPGQWVLLLAGVGGLALLARRRAIGVATAALLLASPVGATTIDDDAFHVVTGGSGYYTILSSPTVWFMGGSLDQVDSYGNSDVTFFTGAYATGWTSGADATVTWEAGTSSTLGTLTGNGSATILGGFHDEIIVAGAASLVLVDGYTPRVLNQGDGSELFITGGDLEVIGCFAESICHLEYLDAGSLIQLYQGGFFGEQVLEIHALEIEVDGIAAAYGVIYEDPYEMTIRFPGFEANERATVRLYRNYGAYGGLGTILFLPPVE